MENSKYAKLHSLLRMCAALIALIVFISMFAAKQVVHESGYSGLSFAFNTGAFFGDEFCKGNVLGFVAYLLVFIGGLVGLAFVFIDEMIGKDLTKTLSFVVGGVMIVCGLLITLFAPIFKAINDLPNGFHTGAAPIVFGVLAILAGAANAAAPILEEKGYQSKKTTSTNNHLNDGFLLP